MSPQKVIRTTGWLAMAALLCVVGAGCTRINSLHNAVPVQRLPPELLGERQDGKEPIDFTLLRQNAPRNQHVIGSGDVLGIHIQEVLASGAGLEPPPVSFPNIPANVVQPVVGHPVDVQPDGTIRLPLVPPIHVAGLTIPEAWEALRRAYVVDRNILQPGADQINVTLVRPRNYRVMVIREDTGPLAPTLINRAATVLSRRGTAHAVDLPVGENDLLHALIASGGLPGEDGFNIVWILRSPSLTTDQWKDIVGAIDQGEDPQKVLSAPQYGTKITKIPLRVVPGQPLPFTPADVILQQGDVIYIESRHTEVFYVGGLMGSGQIQLPRDYDLDILSAIALANGAIGGPAGGPAAISNNFRSGPGNIIPPTRVLVVRTLPTGDQLKIHVNLKRAVNEPRERLIIQPNDVVLLSYTPGEMLGNIALNYINVSYLIPNQ